MPLSSELTAVLADVATARSEAFAGHPVADRIRGPVAESVRSIVDDDSYKTEGSPGKGNWAETLWVSVFDRIITETAMEGFYVVYLFRQDGAGVYLSLNQGTTAIYRHAGGRRYIEVLESTAQRDAGLLPKAELAGLHLGPIDLLGSGTLTRGYEAGNIVAKFYPAGAVPDDAQLELDLTRFLVLYKTLADARFDLEAETHETEDRKKEELEAKRYRWHRRAERSATLARRAKEIHGTTCQVCETDLVAVYGSVAAGYIEAHHLTPFASLEGRPTALDPESDFAVVCPNCHRMLHMGPPYTLDELRAMRVAALTSA